MSEILNWFDVVLTFQLRVYFEQAYYPECMRFFKQQE